MSDDIREILDEWYSDFRESLPARFRDTTIANYELTNKDGSPRGDRAARQRTAEWAASFPDVERGLFLYGATGVGKTHLALGALKAVARRFPARVRYIHMSDYLDRRRTRRISERVAFGTVFRNDLLVVLDEMGATKATDFMAEQVNLMLDALWQGNKRILVTSNQSYAELAALYGERTVSRLVDLTERVHVEGADDRVRRARDGAR